MISLQSKRVLRNLTCYSLVALIIWGFNIIQGFDYPQPVNCIQKSFSADILQLSVEISYFINGPNSDPSLFASLVFFGDSRDVTVCISFALLKTWQWTTYTHSTFALNCKVVNNFPCQTFVRDLCEFMFDETFARLIHRQFNSLISKLEEGNSISSS